METIGAFVASLIQALTKVFQSVAEREISKAKLAQYLEIQNQSILDLFSYNDATENAIEPTLLSNYQNQLQLQQQQQIANDAYKTIGLVLLVLIILGLGYFLTKKFL